MLFTGSFYLLCFLPIALFVYYVLFRNVSVKSRNFLLLFISVAFFSFLEPVMAVLFLALAAADIFLVRNLQREGGKLRFAAILLANVIPLLLYLALPDFLALGGLKAFYEPIFLPVLLFGCHLVQLLLLAYRDDSAAYAPASSIALYLLFYPVYTAGPILEFKSFVKQASERSMGLEQVSAGAKDFVLGLAKVLVLGQVLSFVPRTAFSAAPNISPAFALLAILLFAFQVYFELSGCCQMAKGTAAMFGFVLPINFSGFLGCNTFTGVVTKFHRSVSRFVLDVLMVERKGDRKNALLGIFFVSFLMAAFFGGGSVTLAAGSVLFLVLTFEQFFLHHFTAKSPLLNRLLHFVVAIPALGLLMIAIGGGISQQSLAILSVLDGSASYVENVTSGSMFLQEYGIYYLAAFLSIFPFGGLLHRLLEERFPKTFRFAETLYLTAVFVLCIFFAGGSYLPFFA